MVSYSKRETTSPALQEKISSYSIEKKIYFINLHYMYNIRIGNQEIDYTKIDNEWKSALLYPVHYRTSFGWNQVDADNQRN